MHTKTIILTLLICSCCFDDKQSTKCYKNVRQNVQICIHSTLNNNGSQGRYHALNIIIKHRFQIWTVILYKLSIYLLSDISGLWIEMSFVVFFFALVTIRFEH